ncbi:hypothetical protein FACS1894170_00850 [Planctomycetales bacterium]|nr:hypothetical protein FACS1894170_00850 [Planctomycetales bacterium]
MTWKVQVKEKYFANYSAEFDEKRIDFLVYSPTSLFTSEAFLWAESKKDITSVNTMFAQLLLTIKKTVDAGEMPPKFLGVFDKEKIALIEYHHILPVFALNDFNWNEKPSSVSKKTENTVAKYLTKEALHIFRFKEDESELRDFIKNNFVVGNVSLNKSQITKNNFVTIYNKWVETVKPTIAVDFDELKKAGVLDAEFFLADLLSRNNKSLYQTLKIVLKESEYHINVDKIKHLLQAVFFNDNQQKHTEFWAKYERPPKREYHEYIKNRRDLLVPQKIREQKGAYFTPQIWVEKAHEYLEKSFGENWQDEYYIWDCCCGTANLLANLTNKYNIWASTIDQPDVDIIHDSIDHGFNLLKLHVFRFDFLNGDFADLPKGLRDIINNPEKQKKLIILINPPYAESGDGLGTGTNKTGVSSQFDTHDKFLKVLGKGAHEFYVQFMAQVYHKMPLAKLATFATLKYLNAPNFIPFRKFFRAKYHHGFMVPANTFDNVVGQFPISFLVWELSRTAFPRSISVDVFNRDGIHQGKKRFHNGKKFMNEWINTFKNSGNAIGSLYYTSNDFQNNESVWIGWLEPKGHKSKTALVKGNLIDNSIYFALRHVFKRTWFNERDQFLYPNEEYKKDKRFQNNCLVFTLFHDKNTIRSADGINHWIPFTPQDVNASDNFQSTFMSDFLQARGKFSKEAEAVFTAGKDLWTYYHETIKDDDNADVNASLYDIRAYFKGRKNGRVNSKSSDERFTELDKALKTSLSALAKQIQPKVYEYGFLLK